MRITKAPIIGLVWMEVVALSMCLSSCTTGIESSPQPGIVRVTLQSDQADTQIVILNQTLRVSSRDYFGVTITQGKVYSGEKYAFLFKDKDSYRQEDVTYNILERKDGQYTKFTIFESYVPPVNYTKLQFGVTASLMKLGYFEIPVKLPDGTPLLKDLDISFQVYENRVTEVSVQLSPFKSVKRYRDSYQFTREMKVTEIIYHR